MDRESSKECSAFFLWRKRSFSSRNRPSRNSTLWVYLGVRTCELFLCFAPFVFLGSIVLTSLFSLFYVTREFNRFLHRGWANLFSSRRSAWSVKCNQGSEVFAEFSGTFCTLWVVRQWYPARSLILLIISVIFLVSTFESFLGFWEFFPR